jgi:hypothetical protein
MLEKGAEGEGTAGPVDGAEDAAADPEEGEHMLMAEAEAACAEVEGSWCIMGELVGSCMEAAGEHAGAGMGAAVVA